MFNGIAIPVMELLFCFPVLCSHTVCLLNTAGISTDDLQLSVPTCSSDLYQCNVYRYPRVKIAEIILKDSGEKMFCANNFGLYCTQQ